MRFSPYAMEDYGLRHGAGFVLPVGMPTHDDAAWNMSWASVPEYDKFLDLGYEDFGGFRGLISSFPFAMRGQAMMLMQGYPELAAAFAHGTPEEASAATRSLPPAALSYYFGALSKAWITTTTGRLQMAQTMVDVSEAAEICKNVIAVDFRNRGRL